MTAQPVPYKANHCYAVLDGSGFADPALPRVVGMLLHDTRHLSAYAWDMAGFDLIESTRTATSLTQFWSRFEHHEQDVLIWRNWTLRTDGFDDLIVFRNESRDPQIVIPKVIADADFVDAFELRGRDRLIGRNPVSRKDGAQGISFAYVAQDGVQASTTLDFRGFANGMAVTLNAGQTLELQVTAQFQSTVDLATAGVPSPDWAASARQLLTDGTAAQKQALTDLETLCCSSPHGPYLAAGVPNFVTLFGRDSLISAWFLLSAAPQIAASTLHLLGSYQGQVDDDVRAEQPGKIPHEIRVGELSRCNDVPFGRYYGTTDATALFVTLLRDHGQTTGSTQLAVQLAPHWRAALGWIEAQQDAQGLIRYAASRSGRGLVHTSWKDSDDSVSYADGTLASGRIAVVEIQGYAAAALDAGADLNDWTGGPAAESTRLREKAAALRLSIDTLFWNDRLGLHVIAIDADGRQCDTATSNPGHLLWMGALTPDRARAMADRLMQPDMWSGWGLRTLSTQEIRYKPLSYHNGSVWPHDTGLFAAGLHRYGFHDHAGTVTAALHDIAARQPGLQLPELMGGYARGGPVPPLVYVETCRPQAWAAAALIWAATMHDNKGEPSWPI